MLKMGTYGILRFAMPLFHAGRGVRHYVSVAQRWSGSFTDQRCWPSREGHQKMIAYSSVAHLGFVVLGLMMWNERL